MNKKLAVLQQLRAIAALLVVVDHSIVYTVRFGVASDKLQNFAWHIGAVGVSIFFVISGFIIARTSTNLYTGTSGIQTFAEKRLIRIIPMYWLATSVEILLRTTHNNTPAISEVVCSLFFIPYVLDQGQPLRPILTVGWTLNYEMFFYALFAITLLCSRRTGVRLFILLLVSLTALGSLFKPIWDTAYPTTALTFLLNPIILLFGTGVLIELVTKRLPASLREISWAGPASLAAIGAAVAAFPLADLPLWTIGWQTFMWALCILSVGLAVVSADGTRPNLLTALEILGNASYSIYLFHFIIIAGVRRLWYYVFGNDHVVMFVMTSFIAATVMGLLIHLLIERPLVQHFRRHRERVCALAG